MNDVYGRVLREAATLAGDEDADGVWYISCVSSIWKSQADARYAGCVVVEKKFKELYDNCVAENNGHAILMLLFAAEYLEGEA